MRTNRYGFTYSDDLTIREVDPQSTGVEAGLTNFIGRRIQKVNGIRVSSVAELHNAIIKRDQRSSLSYHIVLHFAPRLSVGTAVRAIKRLTFKYQTVQQGSVGVVLRASMDGRTCTARIGGVIFEGNFNQIETVVDEDIPHKYSQEPSWIIKSDGEKYLKDIIDELNYGHMGYYDKLIAYGINRPDLMALATSQDAEELMIKPHHFYELQMICKKIIRERKRRYNHQLAEDIASNDLTLLAELQTEARKRVLINAARQLEGKPAIPFPTDAGSVPDLAQNGTVAEITAGPASLNATNATTAANATEGNATAVVPVS
eukprot:TRINITY_DN15814_c0_g1_i2.p1 TRINITY_DN15814_c0_g1~~TRINITY_DN15814_c0_g1_i2.p1  ORF type:complete len:316 (+),score=64.63 TRINITY_DN15814_c0_g1_i2:261-1208(+)